MLEKVCRIMEAIVSQASSHLCFATSTSKDGVYTFSYFFTFYKPRGASPLGQFLLVGPLFLCVEKVRGRK